MSTRRLLYNFILFTIALPWVACQLLFVRKRRTGLAQRLGHSPETGARTVWCHAVSVGEVRAVVPMLRLLEEDPLTRGRLVLSTVTVTGQETARRECDFARSIFYFPLDFPFAVNRAIKRVRPELFITAETEIWPNFFAACFRYGIPVVVVNGRISDTSFPRYRKWRWFFSPFLRRVSLFLMQSEEDARRIVEMGALPEAVKVTGNMKYDREPEPVSIPCTVQEWAERGPLIVAGSTHRGEEEAVLEAWEHVAVPGVLLALVPRHPERFGEVAGLLDSKGIVYTRYTTLLDGAQVEGNVILVDAMGVLDGFYALADVAFVGGSLVPVGGHNLLEPAAYGVAVVTGVHLHNFRDVAKTLTERKGCLLCDDGDALGQCISNLLDDPDRLDRMGEGAKSAYESTKGASDINRNAVLSFLRTAPSDSQVP